MTDTERLDILKRTALRVIENCTFTRECGYFGKTAKTRVLVPAGDDKYPSFWVRDTAMMAESGLIAPKDLKNYILITARHGVNTGGGIELENGLYVPPYAVADHVNYDAKPVFYPGTYSSTNNQGTGLYGVLPPLCDNYMFVIMTCRYILDTGDRSILDANMLELLANVWNAYCVDGDTGLCCCTSERRAVDWGFCDAIIKTGSLLFPSLLRIRAARLMAEVTGDAEWNKKADFVSENIIPTFAERHSGMLLSAFPSFSSSSNSFSISMRGKMALPFFTCSPCIMSNTKASSQTTSAYHSPSCLRISVVVVCMKG